MKAKLGLVSKTWMTKAEKQMIKLGIYLFIVLMGAGVFIASATADRILQSDPPISLVHWQYDEGNLRVGILGWSNNLSLAELTRYEERAKAYWGPDLAENYKKGKVLSQRYYLLAIIELKHWKDTAQTNGKKVVTLWKGKLENWEQENSER